MTIRFTETGKWRDKWFRKLSPTEKLLFLWMIDNCDSAGFWEVDLELAAQETGATRPRIQGAFKGLARAYIQSGDYIWIWRFIVVQRNWPYSPENNAHKAIKRLFDEHSEFSIDFIQKIEELKNQRRLQGGSNPPCISISKSIGKSNSKVMHSEFVFLTEGEFQKLIDKFGGLEAGVKIADLNEYIGSTGRKYKSHYHTILNWDRRDAKSTGKRQKSPATAGGNTGDGYNVR